MQQTEIDKFRPYQRLGFPGAPIYIREELGGN